jgi:hypothetical protein
MAMSKFHILLFIFFMLFFFLSRMLSYESIFCYGLHDLAKFYSIFVSMLFSP